MGFVIGTVMAAFLVLDFLDSFTFAASASD